MGSKVTPIRTPVADEILMTCMEYRPDQVFILAVKDGEPCLFHSGTANCFETVGMMFEMIALLREPGE